ncbi:MAG: hypothetical protein COA36_07850 [Desulfotalea sp.]|nr:MAG: hypothetical protein COA36_07850 [Desulfotalea sp.]
MFKSIDKKCGNNLQERWRLLFKGNQLRKDFLLTFSTELLVLVSAIVTLKLAALMLGPQGFGEYAIARRAMNVLAFPMLLGVGISLPRYIALNAASELKGQNLPGSYFYSSCLLIGPIMIVFCVASLLLPDSFAAFFYGDKLFGHFALPVVLITIGLQLHTLVYNYFRGTFRMPIANLMKLFSFGIVPPVAVCVTHGSAMDSLILMGGLWICVNLVIAVRILSSQSFNRATLRRNKKCIIDLLRYGLPRVPGEFALFGLFAIPVFIISHKYGIEEAGYYSFSLSLLQIVGGLFASIGIVLLPRISYLKGKKEWQRIKTIVGKVLRYSVFVSFVLTGCAYVGYDTIIAIFMGEEFLLNVIRYKTIVISFVPYVVYIVLRNPIDALVVRPYNSMNLFITLLTVVLLLEYGSAMIDIQLSMILSLFMLASLTIVSWRKAYLSSDV